MKLSIFIIIILFTSSFSHADELNKRSKTINFEDDVVEGINRKPLDSVNQISERDAKGRPHLYKKRAGFSDREQVLTQELRLQQ